MIKIGFSTQKTNIISRVIRAVTKSRCSHAWLLLDDPLFGIPLVMEATDIYGIRLIPFGTFQARNNIVAVIDAPNSLINGIRSAAAWLGESYDYAGLFGMFWVYLGRVFHKRWRNPWRSSSAMFCSEFVVRVLQAAKCPKMADIDPDSTSPEDLLELLEKAR